MLLPRRRPGERTPLWAQRKRSADCSPWRRSTARSRSAGDAPAVSSRRVRLACSRGVAEADSRRATSVCERWTRGRRRLSRRRCCSRTSRTSSTTGTLLFLRSVARRRSAWTPRSSRSSSVKWSCASCWIRRRSTTPRTGVCSASMESGLRTRRTRSTTCCSPLAICRGRRSRCGVDPPDGCGAWLDELVRDRRAVEAKIAGEVRLFAAEDAARSPRRARVVPPRGLPKALLEPVALRDGRFRVAGRPHARPLSDGRARGPTWAGGEPRARRAGRLAALDCVMEGEFLPGGKTREWCDAEVLRTIKPPIAAEAAARD